MCFQLMQTSHGQRDDEGWEDTGSLVAGELRDALLRGKGSVGKNKGNISLSVQRVTPPTVTILSRSMSSSKYNVPPA